MGEITETTRLKGCHFSSFHAILLCCRKSNSANRATQGVGFSVCKRVMPCIDHCSKPRGCLRTIYLNIAGWVEKMAQTQAHPSTVPWLAALLSHPTWFPTTLENTFNQRYFYPLNRFSQILKGHNMSQLHNHRRSRILSMATESCP